MEGFEAGKRQQLPASPVELHSENGVPDLSNLGSSDRIDYWPPPSADDVTKQLNQEAFTISAGGDSGVVNYDAAQLPSNSPCEDAYLHGKLTSPVSGEGKKDWMAWAVFDGHCGWQLSKLLTKQLLPFVQQSLRDLKPADDGAVSEAAVQQAIVSAFEKLDDALVKSASAIIESDLPFAEKIRRLEPVYAGSCALLTLYDPSTSSLHIASTGDCRAVLGRKTADGTWEAVPLTVDQTGANVDEVARIQKQFPDEPDVVDGGRIWGMQPARTFGDGGWKWDKVLRATLRNEYNACKLPSGSRYKNYKTGPYLTASPVVTTVKIPRGEIPSFLILATDGLWDTMSSEDAVDLVGRWSDMHNDPKQATPMTSPNPSAFGPVTFGRDACYYDKGRATFQDHNAAVHLMRNGLGGAHEEMVKGALAFRSPMSRDIRDDITVQVVFFEGKEQNRADKSSD
ncbi:phosphatase 2C-like domain-containing protein [Pseudomassariella vexata]|uniref:Phosphatase 2C-like domain-containing protein n=1 Tax=Pseudomassariella vexata TaxID=1141098 RepID=A0A1Y2EEW5_9PEZI|nr:phosphatase 2C-like domain-containing protein [Pseudomassariella vexata]ORY70100.1 phosphatase 2C-like domain-containing protein [Pseudomassariella vexata]